MIQVNREILEELKPCENRWNNYLEHYQDFKGDLGEFVDLSELTYDDKIWVATKLLNKTQNVRLSIMCAESVLDNFEKIFPDDKQVRDCLNYLKEIPDYYTRLAKLEEQGDKFWESKGRKSKLGKN